MKSLFFLLLPIIVLASCNRAGENQDNINAVTRIYYNGDIVTMEGTGGSTVESVVTQEKSIVFVGDLEEAKRLFPSAIEMDLSGRTLFPGFIEQHLHPFLAAITISIPMISTEDWVLPDRTWPAAVDEKDYQAKLKAAFAEHKNPDEVFWTWGYHQLFHGELNRKILDEISTETPIGVFHRSCHEFYTNTAFLRKFNITPDDLAKASQIAQEQTYLDKGHFYENGAMVYLLPKIYQDFASEERMRSGLKKMVKLLHMNGITAYNEPGALMDANLAKLYNEILSSKDVPMYSTFIYEGNTPYMASGDGALEKAVETSKFLPDTGKVRFLPNKVKLYMDGAIVSQLMQMKDGYTDGHEGEWMLPPEMMDPATKLFWDEGYQIHIHVNGDKGLEVVLNAIEARMEENPREDHRTVIIHFANSTDEQVKKLAELGCVVSANPYYVNAFTEKFSEIGLGPERAQAMVRLGPAEKEGVSISLHSDLPVAPANPLFLAWCATNRLTNEGNVARPDLAIDLHTAMKAITIDAAYSWGMEEQIGSIKEGKVANFTILDKNPYRIGKEQLTEINIISTVFEGEEFKIEK